MATPAVPNPHARDQEVDLTFGIPMYNEEAIVEEAVRRVVAVGEKWGRPYEVLAVDDGSRDATPDLLSQLTAVYPTLRWVQLRPNCGQPAASKAAMLAANGRMVAVLDADLQTPPELVPRLAESLDEQGPEVDAVFGTTSTGKRDDPVRLLVGQAVFYFLQTHLSRNALPHGASSFFVMRRQTARRVARLDFTLGNIGAVMSAAGMKAAAVTYVKPASYRSSSRLGLRGHVEEAVGSLALTGALGRLCAAGASLGSLGALGARASRPGRALSLAAAGASLGVWAAAERYARRALWASEAPLPIFEGPAASRV
ncbi:MAG TPA: glycosyltransferase [Streptomyces sp.]|uniref:glycosyltransferase n=1 Tax=Streptomyces sp. TaxID=1931 RepID=UPI002D6E0B4F|nr:glycosyltransferase [Streptomyces sp.]HZG04658.1 glycosyltransferase [Streptomyces sp.]